jgi:dynein heavy chain
MAGKDGGGPKLEPRVGWVLNRLAAMQYKHSERFLEKFLTGFAADEASSRGLMSFLDDPMVKFCYFFPTADSVSANSAGLPTVSQMKKKCIVLHRVRPEVAISRENIAESVCFLEMTRNIMGLLNVYCQSVYLSAMMNPANQKGWSDLIAKDLMDKYHVFLANLYVTVGLMQGCTWLPSPPRDALPSSGSGNGASPSATMGTKDRVHVLEGAVITWTKQIRHVLKQDPEQLLKEGKHPEPKAELQFWRNKETNLSSIHSQLGIQGLKNVLKFLETNKSTYTTPFQRLQREVDEAREEAKDNVAFLATLNKAIDKLMADGADFEALPEQFDPLLANIFLIWKHSRFYNTPTRLAVLIREICNSIISQATRYIDGPQIFNMISSEEEAECLQKLERTLRVCTSFRDIYVLYREKASEHGNGGWKMKNEALFCRLDAFRERCRDAIDFVRTFMHFLKLERVEIGGTKGRGLSLCVEAIHQDFDQTVELFKAVPYDIMSVDELV